MEENVISMFMDVKLDIRERKLEFSHLKSWTRYFVRVEAVKCFPCYMKISFFKSATEESTDLIVRINIPGLTVQMATSRTRAHSYGLFWKHNRKRCCAYFALASQLLCERHLRWMKKSIRNLELYRQEILQLRRASRTPMHEIRQEMHPGDDELGVYQNLDLTQDMAREALNDILGPLPNVPGVEQQSEASLRRISGVSGIYEEIFDPVRSSGVFGSGPRASIVSGIYEEMKLTDIKEQHERSTDELADDDDDDIAPPLPPRPRSHTNEFELQRSFTTPESDYLKKKKHWQLFESMFGRRRTNSGSSSTGKTPKTETDVKKQTSSQKVVYRDKVANLRFSENKRNSFSSPDLSALKVNGEGNVATSGDNLSDEGSCSSEFYVQREVDYIEEDCCFSTELLPGSRCPSIEESLANLLINGEDGNDSTFAGGQMNISEKIVPNLNGSCNSSTINLVGFSCTMAKEDPVSTTDGYCEMGAPGTGFNRVKLQEVEFRKPLETDVAESIYMDMDGKTGACEEASRSSSTSSGVSSLYSNTSSSSGKQRNSIDDKIPSYYPNEDFRTPKKSENHTQRKNPKPKETPISKRSASPRSIQHKYRVSQSISTMPRACKSAQKPASSKTKLNIRSASSERCEITPSDTSPTKNIENSPPENLFFQKYATIARSHSPSANSTNSNKYTEKNGSSKKGVPETPPIGFNRRFGSLPRFAKFDLSPLRLKINSVLQRHNSENL